jgi:hypothetical protein
MWDNLIENVKQGVLKNIAGDFFVAAPVAIVILFIILGYYKIPVYIITKAMKDSMRKQTEREKKRLIKAGIGKDRLVVVEGDLYVLPEPMKPWETEKDFIVIGGGLKRKQDILTKQEKQNIQKEVPKTGLKVYQSLATESDFKFRQSSDAERLNLERYIEANGVSRYANQEDYYAAWLLEDFANVDVKDQNGNSRTLADFSLSDKAGLIQKLRKEDSEFAAWFAKHCAAKLKFNLAEFIS